MKPQLKQFLINTFKKIDFFSQNNGLFIMEWIHLPYEIQCIIIHNMTLQSLGRFAQVSKSSKELVDDPFIWRKRGHNWVSIDSCFAEEWAQDMIDKPKNTINRIVCVWNLFLKDINEHHGNMLCIKNKHLIYEYHNDCGLCHQLHMENNVVKLPSIIPLSWLETYDILVIATPENVAQNIYNGFGLLYYWQNIIRHNMERVWAERAEHRRDNIGTRNLDFRNIYPNIGRPVPLTGNQRRTDISSYIDEITYPTKKERKRQMKNFTPKKLKIQNKRINLNSNRHKQKYR